MGLIKTAIFPQAYKRDFRIILRRILCHSQVVILIMHPIFLNDFLIEISVVEEFAILHTVFKLLFPCFLQDVSEGIPKINDPHFLPFCRADFVLMGGSDCQRRGRNRDTTDKKEYISDRIRESIDVFGSQPERLGTILMNAVAVLAMLISKVLQKARELSAKLFDTGQMPPQTPKQEPVPKPAEKEMPSKPKIPPKPVMPAEAAAYPKLFKIYKELKRQNEIIFEAEKERNALELERDDLKGLARFTKKGELQSRIDRKNEEIDILKIGLSGIAKRYGYQNVQEFYKIYHKAHSAYAAYREQEAEWEKIYGADSQKQDKKSVLERLRNPPKKTVDYQRQRTDLSKDRGRKLLKM